MKKSVASTDSSRPNWVNFVFGHPVDVSKPEWYWAEGAAEWPGTPEQLATNITETFEQSGHLLARFSDEQLNQGFWFLVSMSGSNFMRSLNNPKVPLSLRLRALRSFVPVFQQIMAVRCSQHLSHLDERGANLLNSACYMWWDIIPIHGAPEESACAEFDAEVLGVMQQLLAIPHDACRESALHGLGHWSYWYPNVTNIIDGFLSGATNLRPELIAYATKAKTGDVQ